MGLGIVMLWVVGWPKAIFTALYVALTLLTIVVVIHEKRDPVKALAWIVVIASIPALGMLLYVLVGRNLRKEKLFNRKEIIDAKHLEQLCSEQIDNINNPELEKADGIDRNREIIRLLLNNSKALLTLHNRVKILNNGKETFTALFEACRNAQSSIHLEYYIFENDRIGLRLAQILMERAQAGVEVRLIYDAVGSWGLNVGLVRRMRRAGIQVECFMPVVFPWLTSRVNYRNHRKIVVVDGKIAFTGGINIAERYLTGTRFGKWRDIHLKIEGEAVRMLQAIFITDWYFLQPQELLDNARYFPTSRIRTVSPMQIVSSGPDSDWAAIMQAFFAAISKARDRIYIASPYFMPNASLLTAMKVAALSGIDVRVMLPARSDSKVVLWATRSYVSELLEAGIKVYFYQSGFNHSKVIIIDGTFSSVGSANMDIRSFEDNFEVSAIMYDRKIAGELEHLFLEDLKHSTEVTLEAWEARPGYHATFESVARLLSPLL